MTISGKGFIKESCAAEWAGKVIAYPYFLLLSQPFECHGRRGFPAPASDEVFAISHIAGYVAGGANESAQYAIRYPCHVCLFWNCDIVLLPKAMFLKITFLGQIYYSYCSLFENE